MIVKHWKNPGYRYFSSRLVFHELTNSSSGTYLKLRWPSSSGGEGFIGSFQHTGRMKPTQRVSGHLCCRAYSHSSRTFGEPAELSDQKSWKISDWSIAEAKAERQSSPLATSASFAFCHLITILSGLLTSIQCWSHLRSHNLPKQVCRSGASTTNAPWVDRSYTQMECYNDIAYIMPISGNTGSLTLNNNHNTSAIFSASSRKVSGLLTI